MGSDKTKDPLAEGNEFWPGAPTGQGSLDLPSFHIGKYEVTVGQFRACVDAGGCHPFDTVGLSREPNYPIAFVSWSEAVEYCAWLESRFRESNATPGAVKRLLDSGLHVTLPSEAEWEKAARGTNGSIYPWGDVIGVDRADYNFTQLRSVGSFPSGASPYGLLDMIGNVQEWTRSVLRPYPYDPTDGREDMKAVGARVVRGGMFSFSGRRFRVANRNDLGPNFRSGSSFGFRVGVSRF